MTHRRSKRSADDPVVATAALLTGCVGTGVTSPISKMFGAIFECAASCVWVAFALAQRLRRASSSNTCHGTVSVLVESTEVQHSVPHLRTHAERGRNCVGHDLQTLSGTG